MRPRHVSKMLSENRFALFGIVLFRTMGAAKISGGY
jgi:hypothetical protein